MFITNIRVQEPGGKPTFLQMLVNAFTTAMNAIGWMWSMMSPYHLTMAFNRWQRNFVKVFA